MGGATPGAHEPDPERANNEETGVGETSAVGCFPGGASPYGVQDMSGQRLGVDAQPVGEGVEKPEFEYPYVAETDGRILTPGKVFSVCCAAARSTSTIATCAAPVRLRNDPHRCNLNSGFGWWSPVRL